MANQNNQKLVSIGMPVYNGEKFLRRALDSLLSQTYKNFELIISDNASTDSTQEICKEYAAKDYRIRYIRQLENKGANFNFNAVLEQARGEYFMWAAQDDAWDKYFIEKIIQKFNSVDNTVVAIASEAQYTINLVKQAFFFEGKPFYNMRLSSPSDRIKYILRNNYGNLLYSIFKRSSLYVGDKTILSRISQISLNEIPLFILVAEAGNWLVIPEILFFKETKKNTYEQAKWEMIGGNLPTITTSRYIYSLIRSLIYHLKTAFDINRAISITKVSKGEKFKLKLFAASVLIKHYFTLAMRKKRKKY